MLAKSVCAVLSAAIIHHAAALDATPSKDNPVGVVYKAILPENGGLRGSVAAISPIDGNGVKFTVNFENLPTEGGPFAYHLHVDPVPADGNCTSTLGHLDPFGAGSDTPCDASAPESCEVGDLSGKHGKAETDPFNAQYIDYYASMNENDASFFGNRSFVLHYANKTRLACANFEKIAAPIPSAYPTGNCSWPPAPTGTGGVPTSPGAPSPTGPVVGGGSTRELSFSLAISAAIAIMLGLA